MHTVNIGEWPVIVVWNIGQEFPFRLLAQAPGVHQKQDAVHFAELQQTVGGGDSGEGLTCHCGHLHQRLWPVLCERAVKVADSTDLAVTKACCAKRREMLQIIADGIWGIQQCL